MGEKRNSTETMPADKFILAVDAIVRNCGPNARELIFSERLKPSEVLTISRMAPTRQRYEMEQVAAGRRPFQTPKEGPRLRYRRFTEIFNRLARAGLVEKNVRDVRRLRPQAANSDGLKRITETGWHCRRRTSAVPADDDLQVRRAASRNHTAGKEFASALK